MIEVNGKVIIGQTSEELLTGIKDSNMFTVNQSFNGYMKGLRKRLFRVTGELLNPNDYDSFIATMANHGIIKLRNNF